MVSRMSDYIDNNASDGSNNLDQNHHTYSSKSQSPGSSSDEVDKITARLEVESKLLSKLNHSGTSSDNLTTNDESESPVPIDNDFYNMSIHELAVDLGGRNQINVDVVISNHLSSPPDVSNLSFRVGSSNDTTSNRPTNSVSRSDSRIVSQREVSSVLDDAEPPRVDVKDSDDVNSVSESWRSSQSSIVEYLCCLDNPASPSEGENDPDERSNSVVLIDSDDDEIGHKSDTKDASNEVLSDAILCRNSNCRDTLADVTLNSSQVGFEDLGSDMKDSRESRNDLKMRLDPKAQTDNELEMNDTLENKDDLIPDAVQLNQKPEVVLTPDTINHKIVNLSSQVDIVRDTINRNLFDAIVDHSFPDDVRNVDVSSAPDTFNSCSEDNLVSLIDNPVEHLIPNPGVTPASDMMDHGIVDEEDDDDGPNSVDCSPGNFVEIPDDEENNCFQDNLARDTINCDSQVYRVPVVMDQVVQDNRLQDEQLHNDRVPISTNCSIVDYKDIHKSPDHLAQEKMNRSLFDYVVDHSFRDDLMNITGSTPLARGITPLDRNISTPRPLVSTPCPLVSTQRTRISTPLARDNTPLAQISTPPPRDAINPNLFHNIADHSFQEDAMNVSLNTPEGRMPDKYQNGFQKNSAKETPNMSRSLFDFAKNLKIDNNAASSRSNTSVDNGIPVRDAMECNDTKRDKQSREKNIQKSHDVVRSLSDCVMSRRAQDEVTPKRINPNRGRRTVSAQVQLNHSQVENQSSKALEILNDSHNNRLDPKSYSRASSDSRSKVTKHSQEDRVDLSKSTSTRSREDFSDQSLESLIALRESLFAKLGVLNESDMDTDGSQCREENEFDPVSDNSCTQECNDNMARNITSSRQKDQKGQESHLLKNSDRMEKVVVERRSLVNRNRANENTKVTKIYIQEHQDDIALGTKNRRLVNEDNRMLSSLDRCREIERKIAPAISMKKENDEVKLTPVKVSNTVCAPSDQVKLTPGKIKKSSSPTNRVKLAQMLMQNSSIPMDRLTQAPGMKINGSSPTNQVNTDAPMQIINKSSSINEVKLAAGVEKNHLSLADQVKLAPTEMVNSSSHTNQITLAPTDTLNSFGSTDQVNLVSEDMINSPSLTDQIRLASVATKISSSPADQVKLASDEIQIESESDMNVSRSNALLEMMNCSNQYDADTAATYLMNNSQDEEELFILTSVWPETDPNKSQNSLTPATSQESIMDLDVDSTDEDNKKQTNDLLSRDYFKQSIAAVASPAKIDNSNNNNNKLISMGGELLGCIGFSKEMTTDSSAINEPIHSTMTVNKMIEATKLSHDFGLKDETNRQEEDELLFVLTTDSPEVDSNKSQNSLPPVTSQESIMDLDVDSADEKNKEETSDLLSRDYFKQSIVAAASPAKINNSTMTVNKASEPTNLLPNSTAKSDPNNIFQIPTITPSIRSTTLGSCSVKFSLAVPVSAYSLGPPANPRPHYNAFKAPHAKPNAFSAKVPTSSFTVADALSSAKQALKMVISANAVKGEAGKNKTNLDKSSSIGGIVLTAASQIVFASGSLPSTATSGKASFSLASATATVTNALASAATKISPSNVLTSSAPKISSTSSFSGVKVTTSTTNAASSSVKVSTFVTSSSAINLPMPLVKASTSAPVTSCTFKVPVSAMDSLSSATKVSSSATNGTGLTTKVSTSAIIGSPPAVVVTSSATNGIAFTAKTPLLTNSLVSSAVKVSPATNKVIPSAVKVSPATTKSVPSTVKVSPEVVPSAVKASPKVVPSAVKASPKVVPSAVKASPKVVPSAVRASPKVVPSAVKASPKVVPSAVKASPKVVPSTVKVSPKVVTSAVQVSPKVVPSAVKISPKVVSSAVKVSPATTKSVSSAVKVSPKVVPSAVKVSPATTKVVTSAVKASSPATSILSTAKLLPSTIAVNSSTVKVATSVPITSGLSTAIQVSTTAAAVNTSAIKTTTASTSALSTVAKVSTSVAEGTTLQNKVHAGKVRRSSQCLYNPHMDYVEPDSINDLLSCRNRCSRRQAALANRNLLLKPDTTTTQVKGRFSDYVFKRSSKEDVDRLFGELLGGRITDGGHDDVPFEAADVPDFDRKKTLAAKLDLMMK